MPRAESWFHNQIRHFRLLDFQIRLRVEHLAHLQPIGLLVALRARRPDRWSARRVQQAKLNSDGVSHFAHDAAQRIDFADQMSLGYATHRWVARHLRDQVDIQRVERRLEAHACGGHRGLASGMAGADNNYVELFGELHQELFGQPQKACV